MHLKTTQLPIYVNTAAESPVKQKQLAAQLLGETLIEGHQPRCKQVHPVAASMPFPPTDTVIPFARGQCVQTS